MEPEHKVTALIWAHIFATTKTGNMTVIKE